MRLQVLFVLLIAVVCIYLDGALLKTAVESMIDFDISFDRSPNASDVGSRKVITNSMDKTSYINCSTYQGILLITHIGLYEGVGTAFFNLVVDQLLYADMYKLMPIILLNNESVPCFDAHVHSLNQKSFVFSGGVGEATPVLGNGTLECRLRKKKSTEMIPFPGPPRWNQEEASSSSSSITTVTGNSLWTSYFSQVLPANTCHHHLPVMDLHQPFLEQIGVHKCAPFGVRAWPFRGLPEANQPNGSLRDWFYPMRLRASGMVHKYFHLLPEINEAAKRENPSDRCLAVHIRVTDKGQGRRKISLNTFKPYLDAWDGDIYLATDDDSVVQHVSNWMALSSTSTTKRLYYQASAFRSNSTKPTFRLMKNNTHRTNTESLVDIYAMAKCQYFVHGFSAMAEAVIYLNFPRLHEFSVNLDDWNNIIPVEKFAEWLHETRNVK